MKIKFVYIFILTFCFGFGSLSGQSQIKISSDFPGGNISVTKIINDTVWLKPDLSFTNGEWFYWYFRISGISGKQITFRFEKNNVIARYGPAYSINNDDTWKWYGENRVTDNSFSISFSNDDTIAYLSVAFPYTEKNLNEFLQNLNSEEIKKDTLCFSNEKRVIEKITIPSLNTEPENRVLITARHHACEMMANYVIEGIISSLLNDKNLQSLRKNTEFLIIPFVDKDGVENGEQGKNRIPRDHNRDYGDNSIHPATAGIKKFIPGWSDGKLKIALDIHCPWISGKHNEDIYLVGSSDKQNEENQIIFSRLLGKHSSGEVKLYHKNFLPFGQAWNKAGSYSQGICFDEWAEGIDGIKLSTSIEYPYANISGIMTGKDNSRAFGETIAYSINEYLKILNKR